MRMRRIRNHEERKLACLPRMLYVEKTDEDFRDVVKKKEYLDFETLFGNRNPVCMEIGCGKGKFCVGTGTALPRYEFFGCGSQQQCHYRSL